MSVPTGQELSETPTVKTLPCVNVSSPQECLFVIEITETMINQHVAAFDVFQNILINAALFGGFICLLYLCASKSSGCKNWWLLFTSILTGLLHLLYCVHLLQTVQLSSQSILGNPEQQECADYFFPAIAANSTVLLAITLTLISQWTGSPVLKWILATIHVLRTMFGLWLISNKHLQQEPSDLYENAILSFGERNSSHLDIFWSVCKRELSMYDMMIEYLVIYTPFVVTLLCSWRISTKETKDCSFMAMKIVRGPCVEGDFPCVCRKLNIAFIAIIAYVILVLFIARPIQIVYSYAAAAALRDILPSLLQSVVFCFLCSEFILMFCKFKIQMKRKLRKDKTDLLVQI